MGSGAESYKKFNYLLRPAKQVERKLLIETFHRLARSQFDIRDYTYLGFGSVYYADFLLFHRYLYLDKMICVEKSAIPRRMRFNKPFPWIQLRMKAVAEVIPTLRRGARHLVWLDYDCPLTSEIVLDISGMLGMLADGSALIVTVDAEPRIPQDVVGRSLSHDEEEESRFREAREVFGRFLPAELRRSEISRNALPQTLACALRGLMSSEASRNRKGRRFIQLFNFVYADGAQMLTLGGLVGSEETEERVRATGALDLPFIRQSEKPYRIAVPPLTVRERLWLEKHMGKSTPLEKVAFELDAEPLANFRELARHYPQYFETLS